MTEVKPFTLTKNVKKTHPIIRHLKNHAHHYFMLSMIIVLSCLALHGFAADPSSGDVMHNSGLDAAVKATVGPGSVLMTTIMGIELVLGTVAFLKTKNLLVLVGIPVIIIATNALSILIN
jgi:hypothetical protein